VLQNEDPLFQGRLLVTVPDVLGLFVSSWALPCMPMAGPEMGVFTRPILGATVWVEFEQGDPDWPIWVGGFWAPGEMSVIADAATAMTPPLLPTITITTTTGGLSISDSPVEMPVGVAPPGMVTLEYGEGAAQIVLSPTGIYLTAPTVTIVAESAFAVTAPTITLTGATTITGVTTITGATTINGAQTVSGAATFNGAVSCLGAVTCAGVSTFNGVVTFNGATAFKGPSVGLVSPAGPVT
jgi:hypothetical protein